MQEENKKYFSSDSDNSKYNLVFCKANGENFYPTTVNRKFNKVLKKAGLSTKYNIHSLRHSHETIWLKKGILPKIIQERLEHASISAEKMKDLMKIDLES